MSVPNQFTRRWAIRMPDGNLYTGANPRADEKAADAYAQYFGMASPMRDMAAMLGIGPRTEPKTPESPKPRIFDTRDEAEVLFKDLCVKAEAVGVLNWGGCIVESLCTPFTSGDPSIDFAEQIVAWMAGKGFA